MSAARLGATMGDLWDALVGSGCPACRTRRAREERALGHLVRDYAMDADVQRLLSRSGGLCARHTWLATALDRRGHRGPVGAAILLERLIAASARSLGSEPAAPQRRRAKRGPSTDPPVTRCLVCDEGERDARAELRELAAAVGAGDERIRSRLERSECLCAEHVTALLALGGVPGAREIAQRTLSRVAALRASGGARRALSALAGRTPARHDA